MDRFAVIDRENSGCFVKSVPNLRRPNILKRVAPFGSDNTDIKKRKKEAEVIHYIHQSKWISDNFFDLKLIGKGAFGMVYQAKCRQDETKTVAVKEILKKKTSDPTDVAICEIKLVKELGGKRNILPTLKTHESEGFKDMGSFIVMDYFPHDPFLKVINDLTEEEIIHYAVNLISALEYLHSNLIIHRDVKPDNFLYNRAERRYALIDFGLSQRYNKNLDRSEELKRRFSGRSPVISKTQSLPCLCEGKLAAACCNCEKKDYLVVNRAGTPRFLAPEVLVGSNKQTTKIDIWAVGMILFYMTVRNYRFFAAKDELAVISELSAIFGTNSFIELAREHGMDIITSFKFRKLNLMEFALSHRYGFDNESFGIQKKCRYCRSYFKRPFMNRCFCLTTIDETLDDLNDRNHIIGRMLMHCLEIDPTKRLSSSELLKKFEKYQ
uniref:Protein kinase domain-containing protein n=1 Tax=Panagrolaimus sp. JU765 TaxID=591449 RepID=A0AC34QPM8_9BILA